MEGHFVAMRAELFNLQPFGSVPAVFLGCISRNTWGSFGGIGPAFCALKSDHNPDALVFCHKGRFAENAKRSNEVMILQGRGPNLLILMS